MPTRYDKEFKQNIINLYKQGESAAQMAREYGIGYSTVHKWIQGQAKTQSGKSPEGSQHFFGQFAKRLFVKLGHTRKAMLLVQDSLSVLVPLRGCKRSRCKRRLALSDH